MQEPLAPPLTPIHDPVSETAGKTVVGVEQGTQVQITPEVQVHPIPTTATEDDTADTGPGTSTDVSICRVCGEGGERDDWLGCESCEYWVHLPCVGFDMKPGTHMTRFLQKFSFHCPQHRSKK